MTFSDLCLCETGSGPMNRLGRFLRQAIIDGDTGAVASLPYALHLLLVTPDDEETFFRLLRQLVDDIQLEGPILDLLYGWLSVGRPLSDELVADVDLFVLCLQLLNSANAGRKERLRRVLDHHHSYKSPVFGRWRVVAPKDDLLLFLNWEPVEIASAWTQLCGAFFRVRPYEFFGEVCVSAG